MYFTIPGSYAYIYHAKAPVGYLTAKQLYTYHNCRTVHIDSKEQLDTQYKYFASFWALLVATTTYYDLFI